MIKWAKRNYWLDRLTSRIPHAIIVVLVIALHVSGNLSLIDNKLIDLGYQSSSRAATGGIVLVEIDAKSIEALKIWPWPRGYHARVLDKLLDAGAKRVAFDIDFSARSRMEEDRALEAALSRSGGKVILPAFSQRSQTADGKVELKRSAPLPEFRKHTTLASINVRPDSDSLIRSMAIREGALPSLAATLADAADAGFSTFKIDYGIQISSIPRLSFIDVLRGRFDPSIVAGNQVVIGSTAIELGDQLAVPIYQTVPGPLIHILGYESLVQDRALFEVAAAPVGVCILLVTFLLGPLFLKWSWRKSSIALLAMWGGLVALSIGVQITLPVIISVTPMLLATALSFIYAVIKRIDQQALRLIFQNLDLRRKDDMMRNVVQNSFDGIITMDTEGVIESANPATRRIFRDTKDDIVGRNIGDLFPALANAGRDDALAASLRVGMEPHEREGRRLNSETFPGELSVSLLEMDDRRVFTMFLRDITHRKQQQQDLEYQAHHDALTGLPNRKMFYDRLHQSIEKNRETDDKFAVLLIDLDRFKEVNDTLGHPTGDLLLKKISDRLQAATPASDTIARIGGDEFALLLPSTDRTEDACTSATKVLELLCEPFDIAGLTLEISGSIGIAMYPEHGDEAAALVKRADVAMYVAKQGQTGFSIYDAEKDQNSVRFLTLAGDLRRAIDEGQLSLFYQPKICLKRKRIIAVEALVRWFHPEHGFIGPDEFIDKAEQTGVIGHMTEWVLNTALKQTAAWRSNGIEIDMAVNISARLLNDFEIAKMVYTGLRKWQVPSSSLILEVTENALMDDPAKAMEVITGLSRLGARISIDDFGTGYSSLGYLKDLPADELKIDKCFIQSIHEDKSNETIVRSTIGLAHGLGLKVVAEGIENSEIVELLSSLDCDVAQGYLFSKPLPIDEFEEWLATSHWGLPRLTKKQGIGAAA